MTPSLRKATCVLATLASARCAGLPQRPSNVSILPARILREVRNRIAAKWYPSLAIAFVDGPRSEIVTFGKLDSGLAPDEHTVYEIGSITKTFTAALLADALNSNRLTRGTAVAALLPSFRVPQRNGRAITVTDLATQFSGLPYMPADITSSDPSNPFAEYDATKLKSFLAAYRLTRDPGGLYEYSNLGFGLLAYALAQPQSFGDAIRATILQPLRMTSTDVGLNGGMEAHLAPGHNRRNQMTKNWTFAALAGCGAVDSTAQDMLRYLKANMAQEPTSLSRAFRLAQQAQRTIDSTDRIGFAWMTRAAHPQNVIWHNGATFGYASFIGFTADRKRGIVILTNISETVDDLGFAALSDVPLRSYKARATPEDALMEYRGVYALPAGGFIQVLVRNGQLYAQASGEEPIPLFPQQSSDQFFTRIDGFRLIFHRTAKHRVSALVLRQKGERIAVKLKGEEAAAALATF